MFDYHFPGKLGPICLEPLTAWFLNAIDAKWHFTCSDLNCSVIFPPDPLPPTKSRHCCFSSGWFNSCTRQLNWLTESDTQCWNTLQSWVLTPCDSWDWEKIATNKIIFHWFTTMTSKPSKCDQRAISKSCNLQLFFFTILPKSKHIILHCLDLYINK